MSQKRIFSGLPQPQKHPISHYLVETSGLQKSRDCFPFFLVTTVYVLLSDSVVQLDQNQPQFTRKQSYPKILSCNERAAADGHFMDTEIFFKNLHYF